MTQKEDLKTPVDYPEFEVGIYIKVAMQGVDATDAIHRVEDALNLVSDTPNLESEGGGWLAKGRIKRFTVLDAHLTTKGTEL